MEHRDSEPQSFLLFRLLLKIQQIICDIRFIRVQHPEYQRNRKKPILKFVINRKSL